MEREDIVGILDQIQVTQSAVEEALFEFCAGLSESDRRQMEHRRAEDPAFDRMAQNILVEAGIRHARVEDQITGEVLDFLAENNRTKDVLLVAFAKYINEVMRGV